MNHWINTIDRTTENFQEHFANLSKEELNWKPNPKAWSIAQNIDHLIVINQTYFPVLAALKAGTYQTPFTAKIGFLVSYFGKMILNSVKPEYKKKIKTFPIWQPAQSEISEDILDRFTQHQSELKEMITEAKPFLDQGTIISSPANKSIVYKLETAFDIITTHEQRHLAQAKVVLGLLKSEMPVQKV